MMNTLNISKTTLPGFSHSERQFLSALKAHFPKLTLTELKVCGHLLKGLTTKEIAQLMQRSPRSIDAHRYRIRFKLRLATNENLTLFLLEFEKTLVNGRDGKQNFRATKKTGRI